MLNKNKMISEAYPISEMPEYIDLAESANQVSERISACLCALDCGYNSI